MWQVRALMTCLPDLQGHAFSVSADIGPRKTRAAFMNVPSTPFPASVRQPSLEEPDQSKLFSMS